MSQTTSIPKSKLIKAKVNELKEVEIPRAAAGKSQMREIIQARRKEFKSIAEAIAKDSFYYRNYPYEGAKEAYPQDPSMHFCDSYFPHADGGALYVDQPNKQYEIPKFKEKQKLMKKLGFRYLLITPGMTELDCIEAIA